jgi:hypothetical protein
LIISFRYGWSLGSHLINAKSYNDLRITFAAANVAFAALCLALFYESALTPAHKVIFQGAMASIKIDPLLRSILTLSLAVGVWGYVTTYLFRLHDRLYEPHLVSWRAGYEADYILRSLCAAYPQRVSEQFFERAFDDEKARARFMQRLFYKFIGDSKTPHQELLERFYTTIRNYWLLVLAETYSLGFLIITAIYSYLARQTNPPYRAWIAVLLAAILLRVWANRYLRHIRPITAEQISAVMQEHPEEFGKALGAVLTEYNL